jgi:cytolysin-activating lysine-acyltransferase
MNSSITSDWQIIALALIQQDWNEAQVLGASAWLFLHSSHHRFKPLHTLNIDLIPPIKLKQFMLISQQGQPIFFLSWAGFNQDSEQRYVQTNTRNLKPEDWNSGERGWIIDWIAPFGFTYRISRLLQEHYFSALCFRSLYHKGDDIGLRIKEFRGKSISRNEARQWFDSHPVLRQPF